MNRFECSTSGTCRNEHLYSDVGSTNQRLLRFGRCVCVTSSKSFCGLQLPAAPFSAWICRNATRSRVPTLLTCHLHCVAAKQMITNTLGQQTLLCLNVHFLVKNKTNHLCCVLVWTIALKRKKTRKLGCYWSLILSLFLLQLTELKLCSSTVLTERLTVSRGNSTIHIWHFVLHFWLIACRRGNILVCDVREHWWPSYHISPSVTERRRHLPKECDGTNSSETSLRVKPDDYTLQRNTTKLSLLFYLPFIKRKQALCVHLNPSMSASRQSVGFQV